LYASKGACGITINIQKYMKKLAPFFGAILILAGIGLCFFGGKFIFMSVAFLIWVLASLIMFGIVYNFLPAKTITNGVLIGAIVVCAIIGAAIAYCVYEFGKGWFIPILGAWGGIVLVVFLMKLGGIQNSNLELVGAVVGAIGGGYLGKTFNKTVKYTVTAVVGAFFIVRGLGVYLGGFPQDFSSKAAMKKIANSALKKNKYSYYIWAYALGFIVLTICGTMAQFYFFKKDD